MLLFYLNQSEIALYKGFPQIAYTYFTSTSFLRGTYIFMTFFRESKVPV